MESHMLMSFIGLLSDSFQIFFPPTHNGNLMIIITSLTIFINSIFFLINFFYTKHYLTDFVTDFLTKGSFLTMMADPKSQESINLILDVKTHIGFFLEFAWILLLIKVFISLLLSTAIIFASAMIHSKKILTLNDILSKITESWKRPLITIFYTNLLGAGYIFFWGITMIPIALIISTEIVLLTTSMIMSILAIIIYAYLSIVWILALVVSILEEKSGLEALGKANEIAKGMKTYGFFVNLVSSILTYVLFKGFTIYGIKQATWGMICVSLFVLIGIWMVQIFGLMVYTIYYCKCKTNCGEEIELNGRLEYSKVGSMPLIEEDII